MRTCLTRSPDGPVANPDLRCDRAVGSARRLTPEARFACDPRPGGMERGRPGMKMKSQKLKDAGKGAFPVYPLAAWSGFGVVDGNHTLEVHVEEGALQRLDPKSEGADHTHVLEKHRSKILEIADSKYQRGCVVSGNIIRVTVDDVAQAQRQNVSPGAATSGRTVSGPIGPLARRPQI